MAKRDAIIISTRNQNAAERFYELVFNGIAGLDRNLRSGFQDINIYNVKEEIKAQLQIVNCHMTCIT